MQEELNVREQPMFRYDYETRRCLIPACKLYEWKQAGERKKEKYEFFVPGEILYLAGIYHKDPKRGCFTILIREVEKLLDEHSMNCREGRVRLVGIIR